MAKQKVESWSDYDEAVVFGLKVCCYAGLSALGRYWAEYRVFDLSGKTISKHWWPGRKNEFRLIEQSLEYRPRLTKDLIRQSSEYEWAVAAISLKLLSMLSGLLHKHGLLTTFRKRKVA